MKRLSGLHLLAACVQLMGRVQRPLVLQRCSLAAGACWCQHTNTGGACRDIRWGMWCLSTTTGGACRQIPQRVISGTSLAAVATTGATAGLVYWLNGHVDVRSAALLAAGAVVMAPLGARATHHFNCQVGAAAAGWGQLLHPGVPVSCGCWMAAAAPCGPASTRNSDCACTQRPPP